MKVSADAIARALDRPGEGPSVFLLYGPDEAGSRALADRLKRALGPQSEQVDLDSAALKAEPGRLALEAASVSLFGEPRHVRVALTATDDITPAFTELLTTPGTDNPVVILGGALKPTNAVVKMALADKRILSFQSWPLSDQDAGRLAATMAREVGIKLDHELARGLADASGGDRAVLAREIEKFALYLDSAPERPMALDQDMVRLLGAGVAEGDFQQLGDTVLAGDSEAAGHAIAQLASDGITGIPLVRAVARRALGLADHAGDRAGGLTSQPAKQRNRWEESASRLGARWSAARLAKVLDRLLSTERALKSAGALGPVAADAELIAIARAARSARR